jgi:hypothetical protein
MPINAEQVTFALVFSRISYKHPLGMIWRYYAALLAAMTVDKRSKHIPGSDTVS